MNRRIPAGTRRLVLATALAAALAAWLFPHPSLVRAAPQATIRIVQAADTRPADAKSDAPGAPAPGSDGAKAAAAPEIQPKPADANPGDAATAAEADAGAQAQPGGAKRSGNGTDITIDRHGIRVEKGRKHVTVQGLGADREYDSFEEFVQDAPWLAGLVFLVVLLVFLVPLLIIVLLIWYKVRKNRMLNETMLKLAEKGVVPPADALAALEANRAQAAPAAAPMYDLAKQIRQRTVASDLRKGVILIAVGFAFILYWMLGEGEPSWVGLVLLFLGIGYCLLWYLEDRTTAPRTSGSPPPGGA